MWSQGRPEGRASLKFQNVVLCPPETIALQVSFASVSLCLHFYLSKRFKLYGSAYRVFKLQLKQVGGSFFFLCIEINDEHNLSWDKPPDPHSFSNHDQHSHSTHSYSAAALCLLMDPFSSIPSIYFSSFSLHLAKSFCFLICVHPLVTFDNCVQKALQLLY